MKKRILVIFAAVIAGAAVVLGGRWAVYGRFLETTDNAYVKADTVNVAAKIPGRIAEVKVEENALVRAGDPLVILEKSDYEAAVRRAEAEAAARRAALAAINARIGQSEAEVDAASAALLSTEASLDLQKIDQKRVASLAEANYVARQALDRSNASLKDWKGRRESSAANVEAAKASAAAALSEREEAQAALKSAQAALELAELDLQNTIVRAPHDGVAGNLVGRAGAYANPGQRLLSLVPVADSYVVANFKETQIARMRPGAKVKLKLDAYPGASVEGEVESFAPASGAEFSLLPPENATGNFTKIVQRMPVRIRIVKAPADINILPGLSVTAVVDTRGDASKTAQLFRPRTETEASRLGPSGVQ